VPSRAEVRGSRRGAAGAAPLPPAKRWRAILLATLLFLPGYWFLLNGQVAAAVDPTRGTAAMIAFGLAVIPFVFILLAFGSEHPRAPGAVLRAMGLALLVGIPVLALVPDGVTGLVAGMGAGGIAALRADLEHGWKPRAAAVLIASALTFVLLRIETGPALLLAPALPFTSIGVADHYSERRNEPPPGS
jgi:hypothetical protein